MKSAMLTAATILAIPPLALAADKCANAVDQATMNVCADAAFKQSDKMLNELYRQIEARLKDDADTKKLLVQAQQAWVTFRDAECSFRTSTSAGGTVTSMLASMCMDGLTQSRVKDFENYLKCKEGDLSCPVPSAK
ncbi:DUF1311 domain-containing protein [Microvirga sp. 3-52]|nr:DUF1311 domain-containing protein [Microvirga sp. 3-52]